jgi:hypothetical protein
MQCVFISIYIEELLRMQYMSKLSEESHFQVFHSYSASWL